MNKYELVAKVSKYATVVSVIFIAAHFGLNVSFDKNKFTDLNK
jgi:hypothetical protein